jgi:nucleotidyltransferase substrate binding protein (TIGR01987 family)
MDKKVLLDDFHEALDRFVAAMEEDHTSDIEKAGCIQYFEFTFEISWKTVKAFAEEMGLSDCLSPKAALKCAFGQGWIHDETLWLDMLANRNRMSHTYEAESALDIYKKLGAYIPAFRDLYAKLSAVK